MSLMQRNGNTITFYTEGLSGCVGVRLKRTLRVPDGFFSNGLPPDLGDFPIKLMEECIQGALSPDMREKGGVLVPMHQYEAMWFRFESRNRPSALQILAGKINAVTGEEWNGGFDLPPRQNYYILGRGEQPWVDGWKTASGTVRQFIAVALGEGKTVEFQKTGKEDNGGIQLVFSDATVDMYTPPSVEKGATFSAYYGGGCGGSSLECLSSRGVSEPLYKGMVTNSLPKSASMGLGAGGLIDQKIYPDNYGIDWNKGAIQKLWIHLVNPIFWKTLTGEECPTSPVTMDMYINRGWQNHARSWFFLHDQHKSDVPGNIGPVHSVQEITQSYGQGNIPAQTVPQTPQNTAHISLPPGYIAPSKF